MRAWEVAIPPRPVLPSPISRSDARSGPADRPPPAGEVDVAALYRRHAPTVARWAARLGGPAVDADDVVQEVFLVARRRLRRFEGPGAITTWLFRATERIVQTARRKARLRALLARLPFDLAPAAPRPRPTPLERIERSDTIALVYRLLDRLPDRQRQVLILFEIEGLTTHEIAALTGAQLVTVRVWLHRARTRFAEMYAAAETP